MTQVRRRGVTTGLAFGAAVVWAAGCGAARGGADVAIAQPPLAAGVGAEGPFGTHAAAWEARTGLGTVEVSRPGQASHQPLRLSVGAALADRGPLSGSPASAAGLRPDNPS